MALNLSFTRYGVAFSGAYHRVVDLQNGKNGVRIHVETHADAAARANGDESIAFRVFEREYVNGWGSLADAYAHLKSLPEFSGAVDV